MNWADFQPGRRVVCIGEVGEFPPGNLILGPLPQRPVKGRVYTIKKAELCRISGKLSLDLFEIVNEPVLLRWNGVCYTEPVLFLADYFRPLDDTRLDQFRKLLAPTPEKAVQP